MKLTERHYRDQLAHKEGGKTEVQVPSGYIDVLTDTDVIEVKFYKGWKEAVGQVLAYGYFRPSHQKRIHLILPAGLIDNEEDLTDDADEDDTFCMDAPLHGLDMVLQICTPLNIQVTYVEDEESTTYRYFIGLMSFDSPDEVEDHVKRLLAHNVLTLSDHDFMVVLLNLAPWVTKKWRGPITSVRIIKHSSSCTYFQARSENGPWLGLSYSRYLKYVHKAKEEVEDYELPEPWDY